MSRRRWWIPEVVQTSAMDCGPACLAALLAGFGVQASYERLREACHTDVDGTSIDTLEEAATQLGLDAEQLLIPVDQLLPREADALPAVAVVRQPDGSNHFVVLWNRVGDRVQVMDPAVGRRWLTTAQVREALYVHEMPVPAELWRDWAGSAPRRAVLIAQAAALGIPGAAARVHAALAAPGWRPIATLDAAVRLAHQLRAAGAVTRRTAPALVDALVADPAAIPADSWGARATADEDTVVIRGAVVLRATACTPTVPDSVALAAALREPAPRPWRHLWAAARAGSAAHPTLLALAIVLVAALGVGQAVLWRALFDTNQLTPPQLAAAFAALVVYLLLVLALEGLLLGALFRLGRRVELTLRSQFLAALGRLGLPYLRSRPISDLAERSHSLHQLRELPWLGAHLVRVATGTALTGAGLVWLAPATAPLVAALVVAALGPPLFVHARLAERELRVRTHHGAMTRFFLDALLGAVPARAHGIERPLRREHERRLVEWQRAALGEHAFATRLGAVQAALVVALATALVVVHAHSDARPASVLLAIFWTVTLTVHGATFTALVRGLPAARNQTLRLLEPLGQRGAAASDAAGPPGDVTFSSAELRLEAVKVVAGGHVLLDQVDLVIPEGQHVAIVGPSGAGKSTLVGLFLGWHRAIAGTVRVGDRALDEPTLAALRRRTVWVDPAVELWNDTLAGNLLFGVERASDLGATVVEAELGDVLARLPEGMQTRLGERGGLLSGGEAQRVRLGRGLGRRDPLLVLLDEPFRGIDRERRRALLGAARVRWYDKTLLCVTHDLAHTATFDRVLVVEGGAIVEDGPPAALAMRADSRYAALLAEEAAGLAQWQTWRTVGLAGGRVHDREREP